MKRFAIRALLALLALTVAASAAEAYVVLKDWDGNTRKWNKTVINWYVHTNLLDDVSEQNLLDALQGAFDAWEDVDCSTISFNYGGKTSNDPGGGIFVRFQQNSWDPSVGDALAYSVSDGNFGGTITSNEVVFNGYTAEWSVSSNPPPGKSDIQGVATHELGHSIGLDHPRHIDSTMFFSGGSTELRTLEPDDERGACFLYPATTFDDGLACDSCDSTADCSNGVCLNWGGGHTYCGQNCTSSAQCPDGMSCYEIEGVANPQCLPDNEFCHQYGSNIGLGEFCYGHETCASGLCLVLPGDALCSQQCNGSCPAGFTCSQGFCLVAGNAPYGAACDTHSDCATATCIHFFGAATGICTSLCGDNGGSCPDGNQCFQNSVCIPPGEGGNGTSCLSGTDCQGTWCISGKCSQACATEANCPEGTSCVGGFCEGTEIGGACGSTQDCPAGQLCYVTSSGSKACGQECNSLSPFTVCSEQEACIWHWISATEKVSGVCEDKNGGLGIGEPCTPGACEVDLVCHEGEGDTPLCRKDCKLQANNLGCSSTEKCVTIGDPKDPLHGVCVDKVTQPPDPGPGVPDEDPEPDPGPSPDPEPEPEPDPAGPDAGAGGAGGGTGGATGGGAGGGTGGAGGGTTGGGQGGGTTPVTPGQGGTNSGGGCNSGSAPLSTGLFFALLALVAGRWRRSA